MKMMLIFSLILSSSAFANYCAQDAEKFCGGIDFANGEMTKCLSGFKDKLSPACAKELNLMDNKSAKSNPCYQELANFCTDSTLGEVICLLKNENKLSTACAADFAPKKKALTEKNQCVQDSVNFCYSELSQLQPVLDHCLVRHQSKLTPACKKITDVKIVALKKSNACFDDSLKFCPEKIGFFAGYDCLVKQKTLTPDCKKMMDHEGKRIGSEPCYKDSLRFCKAGSTQAAIEKCLTLNDRSLESSCKHFRVQKTKKKL